MADVPMFNSTENFGGLPSFSLPNAPAGTVSPFLTPDQSQALNNMLSGANQTLINMGANYTNLAARTQQAAGSLVNGQLDNTGTMYHQGLVSSQAANDNAIARGLGASSIRDANLADISTTTMLNRMAMFSSLANQYAADQRTYGNIDSNIRANYGTYAQDAVANAQGITPVPQPPAAPAPGPLPPPAQGPGSGGGGGLPGGPMGSGPSVEQQAKPEPGITAGSHIAEYTPPRASGGRRGGRGGGYRGTYA